MKHKDLTPGSAFRFADDENKRVCIKIGDMLTPAGTLIGGAVDTQEEQPDPMWSTLMHNRDVVPMMSTYWDQDCSPLGLYKVVLVHDPERVWNACIVVATSIDEAEELLGVDDDDVDHVERVGDANGAYKLGEIVLQTEE